FQLSRTAGPMLCPYTTLFRSIRSRPRARVSRRTSCTSFVGDKVATPSALRASAADKASPWSSRPRSRPRIGVGRHRTAGAEPPPIGSQAMPLHDAEPEAQPQIDDLIFDWNARNRRGPLSPLRERRVTFFDETLRDGIQSPSVRDPSLDEKKEILRLTASLGIDAVDLGLPGAGKRAVDDVTALIEFAEQEKLG